MRIVPAVFLTIFLFSFASWLYVVGIQYFMPHSVLVAPLTHWSKTPRVDDFGMLCFIISVPSFFLFLVTHTESRRLEWF